MAALHSRCGRYIFVLWFLLSSFFFSFPRLIFGRAAITLGIGSHSSCCFFCCLYRQKFASGDKVTTFGKEYLCNACLSREPNVLCITSTSDDADTDEDERKLKTKYSSVSAPATPAKQDLSVTGRSVTISDADISLDMSTRSLLEVQTTDGMYGTVLLVYSVTAYRLD